MAVTVDVYGSRVSNDLFRHISIGKYKYNRCFTHVPITTLYEKSFNFQKKNIDDMDLDDYEKTMFRVQVSKTLPQILKKNKSDILIIDLADELMERCELKSETTGQIAVISCNEELCKQFIFNESEYSLTRTYEPFDIEFGLVEEKYKKFASDILYSDSNPNGYHPEQIIII